MGLTFLLLLGLTTGWIASIAMDASDCDSLLVNVTSGIGGALIVGILVNPLFGLGNVANGAWQAEALLAATLGAISLLLAVNLLRCREMR